MKPYYETDLGKLYHGDCLDVMKELDDNSIDLVLTDPPYGIGRIEINNDKHGSKKAYNGDYGDYDWNKSIPENLIFDEIKRVSKFQIIWGCNYYQNNLTEFYGRIFWDKLTGGDYSDGELAYVSHDKPLKKVTIIWNGMLQQNMKDKEKRYHPTQKPIDLGKWCLNNYAKKGQLIFDGFAGSGTFLIACEEIGYKWIGVEREKEYCDIIVKRLQSVTPYMF